MEKALKYELEKAIPQFKGHIYPTNAPESEKKPYLVYTRISTKKGKTLSGFTSDEDASFMFSIMATRYEDMKTLTKEVETFLIKMPTRSIGEDGSVYVQDIDINDINETYESALVKNRGIIDFTIYTGGEK